MFNAINGFFNTLAPLPRLPPPAQWRLIDAAFAPMRLRGTPSLLPIAAGLLAFATNGQLPLLGWAIAAAMGVALCRLASIAMTNSGMNRTPASWAARYAMCTLAESCLLGVGGGLAAWYQNPTACALMLAGLGFAAAHAAESSVFAPAARCRIVLLLGPLAIFAALPGVHGSPAQGFPAMAMLAALQAAWATAVASHAPMAETALAVPLQFGATAGLAIAPVSPSTDFQKSFGRDPATGLPNQPRFLHMLAHESARAVQGAAPLSVMLVQCNDLEHWPTGIAGLTKRLQSGLWRPGDLLASFGGGRFAVLLPFTDAMGCDTVARKLQASLPAASTTETTSPAATLSIGMATYTGQGQLPPAQLMEFAERALIDARASAGNSLCRYDPLIAAFHPPQRANTAAPHLKSVTATPPVRVSPAVKSAAPTHSSVAPAR
jgi:diguanylate cyclase (GGDEF)-like protein